MDILNPIELGTPVDAKTFFLDVKVSLNDRSIVHLEMQVINQYNWPERSLCYLCRTFDSLRTGEGYTNVKPVTQIGLLDYTLFPEYPEFYATYEFRNVKNHHLYSDKLRLSVLNLSRIDLATAEDKHYQIDYWASLFKSTTWEEIKMLAKDNNYISDAASTVYRLSQEEMIRLQCEAREDYYRTQLDLKHEMERRDAEIEKRGVEIEKRDAEIEKQNVEIKSLSTKNHDLSAKMRQKDNTIESLSTENQNLSSERDKLLAWILEHGYQPDNET